MLHNIAVDGTGRHGVINLNTVAKILIDQLVTFSLQERANPFSKLLLIGTGVESEGNGFLESSAACPAVLTAINNRDAQNVTLPVDIKIALYDC